MTHRRLKRTAALSLLILGACAPPTALAQQEDGVFVDPGAPSTKEYALPLEAARQEGASGAPTGSGTPAGDRSAPLFGAGITPDAGESSAAQRKGDTATGDDPASKKPTAGRPDAAVASAPMDPPTRRLVAGTATGSDGTAAMAVGGAAVLIVALGCGLLFRRRNQGGTL